MIGTIHTRETFEEAYPMDRDLLFAGELTEESARRMFSEAQAETLFVGLVGSRHVKHKRSTKKYLGKNVFEQLAVLASEIAGKTTHSWARDLVLSGNAQWTTNEFALLKAWAVAPSSAVAKNTAWQRFQELAHDLRLNGADDHGQSFRDIMAECRGDVAADTQARIVTLEGQVLDGEEQLRELNQASQDLVDLEADKEAAEEAAEQMSADLRLVQDDNARLSERAAAAEEALKKAQEASETGKRSVRFGGEEQTPSEEAERLRNELRAEQDQNVLLQNALDDQDRSHATQRIEAYEKEHRTEPKAHKQSEESATVKELLEKVEKLEKQQAKAKKTPTATLEDDFPVLKELKRLMEKFDRKKKPFKDFYIAEEQADRVERMVKLVDDLIQGRTLSAEMEEGLLLMLASMEEDLVYRVLVALTNSHSLARAWKQKRKDAGTDLTKTIAFWKNFVNHKECSFNYEKRSNLERWDLSGAEWQQIRKKGGNRRSRSRSQSRGRARYGERSPVRERDSRSPGRRRKERSRSRSRRRSVSRSSRRKSLSPRRRRRSRSRSRNESRSPRRKSRSRSRSRSRRTRRSPSRKTRKEKKKTSKAKREASSERRRRRSVSRSTSKRRDKSASERKKAKAKSKPGKGPEYIEIDGEDKCSNCLQAGCRRSKCPKNEILRCWKCGKKGEVSSECPCYVSDDESSS
jgi:hypothetical protein